MQDNPTIRLNNRNDTVKEAQRRLSELGFSIGNIDGIFGIRTKGAAMAFQRLSGLSIDGVIGPRTWEQLARQDAHTAVSPPVPPDYKQFDDRWGEKPYTSTGDRSQTMASSACGPTSASMAIEALCRIRYDPWEAAQYALKHGYRTASEGTSWGYFRALAKLHRLDYQQSADDAWILAALQAGGLPVCSMSPGRWTKGGHFILPYKVDAGGNVDIRDCGTSTKKDRFRAPFSTLASQCKQVFAFFPK